MKFKVLFNTFVICLVTFNCTCQCIEIVHDQLWNGWVGASPGFSNGQTVRACENGVVTGLIADAISSTPGSIIKIQIYRSASNYTNLVWTLDNYQVPYPTTGWVYIDLTQGIGSYSLNYNEIFSIRITTISGNFGIANVNSNPYPYGTRLWHDGANDFLENLDLGIKVAMNFAPLARISNTMYPNLNLAINAAQPNDTIHVIEDFTETLSIPLPQDVILNIPSSKTVTLDGSFTNNGTIINNGTLIKNTLTNNVNGIYLGNGTFTGNFINNGTFKPGG